jgi:transcriptional antiterminator RfaH
MKEPFESTHWYAAETHSRCEAQAERHLDRQQFISFCPRFNKLRRHARRVDHVLAPLFPGYIFVRFDHTRDSWHAINGTLGVKRLVGPSFGLPQAMPDQVMQALLSRCQSGRISALFSTLQPGQQVRLASGPFANMLAEVEKLDDRGRVRVLLDILGGLRPLDLQISDLAPV